MGGLIRYAGYDGDEGEYEESYRRRMLHRALLMFRHDKLDTLEIAKRLRVKEPTVVRWLDMERNREYAERK